MNPSKLDSSLIENAHLARRLAERECPHAVGGDCTWFHGAWLYFRVLGVVTEVGSQANYFRQTLRRLAGEPRMVRVLISGAADDAMARIVLDAFRDTGAEAELTMLDRCETPLALSRASANRLGASMATYRADILDFDSAKPFDIVLTNSFLPYFDAEARVQLFTQWASLLRVGGKLLTTNRLRPTAPDGARRFSGEEAETFCSTVRSRADICHDDLGVASATLVRWARDYTAHMRGFPTRSSHEVVQLLHGAGFAPDHIETTEAEARNADPLDAGPTARASAPYLRVLATRM